MTGEKGLQKVFVAWFGISSRSRILLVYLVRRLFTVHSRHNRFLGSFTNYTQDLRNRFDWDLFNLFARDGPR
jgi:hypothetical protein